MSAISSGLKLRLRGVVVSLDIEHHIYGITTRARAAADRAFHGVLVFQHPEGIVKLVVMVGIVRFCRAVPDLIPVLVLNGYLSGPGVGVAPVPLVNVLDLPVDMNDFALGNIKSIRGAEARRCRW